MRASKCETVNAESKFEEVDDINDFVAFGMEELRSLNSGHLVTDSVIIPFLHLMSKSEHSKANYVDIKVLDSFFHLRLKNKGDTDQLLVQWGIRRNILESDIVLAPIHHPYGDGHWTLLIMDLKNNIFLLLDSLKSMNSDGVQAYVNYMSTLYCTVHSGKKHMDWSKYTFLMPSDSDKQTIDVDCGVL